jgi:hypothetical protein
MKLKNKTLAWLLALGVAAALPEPSAKAASAVNGDILVGFRATGGAGSTKNLVVNIGAATALESATGAVNLGNINADLNATYGSDWATRTNLFWGAVGTVGSFNAIGTNPARTVYSSRSAFEPWLRANSSSHAAATNKVVALMTAFNSASVVGVSHANGVIQTTTGSNSWSSYQPGGTITNSGPAPGISFAFFNPTIEAAVASDAALVHLYRVKPAAGAEIGTAGDYLGMLVLESSGSLIFDPAASLARLSIATPVVSVLQGSETATVMVRRVPGTGVGATATTSVAVATADGVTSVMPPFSAGLVGKDYTQLTSTVSFAANEFLKPVTVTLLPQLVAVTNRRFTVNLSSPAANAVLGAASASVQIISDTAASPTIRFSNPSGIASSTVWPVVASGIAGSPIGVDRVEVSLNNGPVVVATLGSATSPVNVPWSASFEPVQGLNRLVATVYDLSGNSATVRRSFRFVRRYNVSLTRSVPTDISATPDTAGLVALLATPAANASVMTPSAVNTITRLSEVVPGTTVKFTATAKVGYSFSHWSGLPGSATVAGDVVSFTMPAANVAITATYTANVFGGDSNQTVGTFVGLVRANAGTVSSNDTEGFVSGTLTASSGLFAGRLLIGGELRSYTGNFYGNGSFFFTVGITKVPVLDLGNGRTFDMSFAGDVITAEITNATLGGSSGSINRALYSTASKVPSALLNAVVAPATISTRGIYTVGFPAKAQTPELDTSLFPQGDGIATITVLDTGMVTLVGTLADGTAITASSNLVAGNVCPIFVQLNTPGSTTVKGGSFGGILTFDATQANSDVSGVDLRWFRPAVTAPTTPNPVMDLYTAGWPTGIKVDAVGALYDATLTLQSSLGAGAPATATAGNTDLLFDNVRYKSSPTGSATVYDLRSLARTPRIVNSVVTLIPSGTTSYTLTAVQATGTFSGTVAVDVGSLITDPSKPPYRGIIVQKGTNKGGYGYVISATTGDRDPQSGGVSLTAK